MFRFLLTRRWIGLFLVAVIVGVACVELGLWQFRRYTERKDLNVVTEMNMKADPADLGQVMSTDSPVTPDSEWTVVTATGTYDPANTFTVRYRTRDSQPGVDVVVPLVTDSGTAVLVDRGWISTPDTGDTPDDIPAPPSGEVTVTGWTRVNGTGSETEPVNGSVRAISSTALAASVPYPLYDGFVDLTAESPSVKPSPELAEPPDLSTGPHFFYGLQWFFFAMLAFGFWGYFAYSEYQMQNAERQDTAPPSEQPTPSS